MDDAGEIDTRKVDAQQARRIIDRLVGYEVSDLLWKKIWRGLSAGRVQTVALRIIVEREREIEAFRPGRVLDGRRGSSRARRRPPFPRGSSPSTGKKLKFDGTDPRLANEAAAAARSRGRRERGLEGRPRRDVGAPQEPAAALHHVAAPAGRGAAPRLRRAPHDADRAAALRGTRHPRPRHGRPHHLHAHRLDARLRRGAHRRPRAHRRASTGPRRSPSRRASSRAGATRRTRTRRSGRRTSTFRPRRSRRTSRPDEAKLYRLIWERFVASQMNPGRLRHDVRRDRGGPRGLPRLRLDAEVRRATSRPTGSATAARGSRGARRTPRRTARACRRSRRASR